MRRQRVYLEDIIIKLLRAGGTDMKYRHEHLSNMLVSSETIHLKNALIATINYSFLAKYTDSIFWISTFGRVLTFLIKDTNISSFVTGSRDHDLPFLKHHILVIVILGLIQHFDEL